MVAINTIARIAIKLEEHLETTRSNIHIPIPVGISKSQVLGAQWTVARARSTEQVLCDKQKRALQLGRKKFSLVEIRKGSWAVGAGNAIFGTLALLAARISI